MFGWQRCGGDAAIRSELSEGIYLQALKVQGLVSVMSEILNQSHFNDQRITEQRRPNSIVKVIKDINNISARYQSGEGVFTRENSMLSSQAQEVFQ